MTFLTSESMLYNSTFDLRYIIIWEKVRTTLFCTCKPTPYTLHNKVHLSLVVYQTKLQIINTVKKLICLDFSRKKKKRFTKKILHIYMNIGTQSCIDNFYEQYLQSTQSSIYNLSEQHSLSLKKY